MGEAGEDDVLMMNVTPVNMAALRASDEDDVATIRGDRRFVWRGDTVLIYSRLRFPQADPLWQLCDKMLRLDPGTEFAGQEDFEAAVDWLVSSGELDRFKLRAASAQAMA